MSRASTEGSTKDTMHALTNGIDEPKRGPQESRRREDCLLIAASLAILLAMGIATVFHLRYSKIDQSVMPGHVDIQVGQWMVAAIDIQEDMSATIRYAGHTIHGKLSLKRLEKDGALYDVQGLTFEGEDTGGALLQLMVPRSGLQGDFCGPWMIRLARPVEKTEHCSWIFTYGDGTACSGGTEEFNIIEMRHPLLVEESEKGPWHKDGALLVVEEG